MEPPSTAASIPIGKKTGRAIDPPSLFFDPFDCDLIAHRRAPQVQRPHPSARAFKSIEYAAAVSSPRREKFHGLHTESEWKNASVTKGSNNLN